jgi:hypothetical protein
VSSPVGKSAGYGLDTVLHRSVVAAIVPVSRAASGAELVAGVRASSSGRKG